MTNYQMPVLTEQERDELVGFLGFLCEGSSGQHQIIYQIALAALTAKPVATAHRLVNKRSCIVHPWVYGSKEREASEGDIFRVEVMPLYPVKPVFKQEGEQ